MRLIAAAAASEDIAQAALFAYAVCRRQNQGQVAAVKDIAEHAGLRAAEDEQQYEYPQATVAAEVSETVH